jgi:hypothetical protein
MEPIYQVQIRRDGTMTYQEAIAAGYRTINLTQRIWHHEDAIRQEETGQYRGFKGIKRKRNRISYAVRFPAVHVVKPGHWDIFIVRVSCFADAERLARKIGEGTVIQRYESRFRAWNFRTRRGKRTATAFGIRRFGSKYYRRHVDRDVPYQYWMMRDGRLQEVVDEIVVR